MDCSAVKPRMEALVNGSLPAPDRALAEQHISTCEGCRLELELVRAIGSQDQAQSGQAPPDWTLDRIFGPETAQGQGRPPQPGIPPLSPGGIPAPTPEATAAPGEDPSTSWERAPSASGPNPFAAVPEPSATVPSAPLPEPTAAEASSDSPGADAQAAATPSWDFEPADAKGAVRPSEESLFFAEEALQRRNNPKASNFRVILWGAGGVVGAIVLALSSWFVLHMAPQGGDDSMRAAAAPPISSPQAGGESAGTAPVDPGAITPVPVPLPTPAQETAGAASYKPPVSASSAGQPPPLPDAAPLAAEQPAAHQAEPPAASKPAAVSRRTSDPAGHHSSPKSSQPSAQAIKPSPEPVADETASMDPGDASASGADDAEPQQAVQPIPYAPRMSAPPPAHAGETASPQTAVPRAAGKPSEENAPPPEIHSPIERIHLATVAAAEQEDLAALRRLRSTWKDFMSKMGVGPERARARREYADCLWAIQSLTGRRGDQKDALAAYREYLLSAPAGGADSQSVSRLRQLEDALAEKH